LTEVAAGAIVLYVVQESGIGGVVDARTIDQIEPTRAMLAAEQAAFVSLASTLTAEQFSTPSLCKGWDVRDVVVHAAAHIHGKQRDASVIAEYRRRSDDDLVEWLASPVKNSRSRSARFRAFDAHVQLGELLIHQQDVLRPLGLTRVIPGDHVTKVLDFGFRRLGSAALAGARRRTRGLHVVATDQDWSFGQGADLRGAAEAILMVTAGRPIAETELTGSGTPILLGRVQA
jgi:uncharacterized protein (TIGR03083 family)